MGLVFEEVEVGMRFRTPARTIVEADIANFAGISGDFNPLHTDAVFAQSSPYGRPIAHGMLALSIVTGLRQRTGVFDGTLLGFLEVRSWRFLAPVFPGDTIHAINEVAELRETSQADRGVMIQRVEVRNQRDELVQDGEFVTLLKRRADDDG